MNGDQKILTELAIIELGSNVNPEKHLPAAVQSIAQIGSIRGISKVYETEPFGPPGQPPFINAAIALETALAPLELRRTLRQIEAELGRQRSSDRYAPRQIDLDICLYGGEVIDSEQLTLPDPDIFERPYLARTIAELVPDQIHPISGEPMQQIADQLDPDHSLQEMPALTQSCHAVWHNGMNGAPD